MMPMADFVFSFHYNCVNIFLDRKSYFFSFFCFQVKFIPNSLFMFIQI